MDQEAFLSAMRTRMFAEQDASLYTHIGYFIAWFSVVELQLTFLLAVAVSAPDLDDFELLVKGMDARVKCERLRKACKRRCPIGHNLKLRLDWFEKNSIRLRNKIAHSSMVSPDNGETVYFANLAKQPYAAMDMPIPKGVEAPESTTKLDIFEHAFWLQWFAQDLGGIISSERVPTAFEIDHPRSPEPPGARLPSPRKDRRAKPDRRSRMPPS